MKTRAYGHGSDWLLSAAMLVALGIALWSFGTFLTDRAWWLVGMLVATIVMLAAALVRQFASRQRWATLAAAVAALLALTAFFAPQSAFLGIIPTPGTLEAFRTLEARGMESIGSQTVPADAEVGIVFLLSVGLALIALVMDSSAHLLRAPALAGIPLLVLLIIPASVRPWLGDPWIFALVAVAYLGMLLVRSTPTGRRAALGISATALVGSLVLPLVLPPVASQESQGSGPSLSLTAGVNPILSLGSDLRRGQEVTALTYTTSSPQGQYLRLTALDDFSGKDWKPSNTVVVTGNTVDVIAAPAGLGDDVSRATVTTQVEVQSILSRWLPVPYAPSSVTGLEGQWGWEPDALAIRTKESNARGQKYTVQSIQATPSVEQLLAANQEFGADFDRYLQLPEDLPDVVRSTALEVVGEAATDYESAIALQNYFRGGEFTYSEKTPVAQDYDGTGAAAIGEFLRAKAGYCVHFSSAMAAMARSLDIPARVAVGFTPGEVTSTPASDEVRYSVTTYDFHAWPELFFTGIGWVRFEPTPGRGTLPSFAPLAADDPSTPDVDESVPQPEPTSSAAAPTPTSSPTAAAPVDPDTPDAVDGGAPIAAADRTPWAAIVVVVLLAILLTPAIARSIRRQGRIRSVRHGFAAAAWDELFDTTDDLGDALGDGLTPRQVDEELAGRLGEDAREALARLRGALETESFAERPGSPSAADLRIVLKSLRREAGLRRALRATFLPRSLVRSWVPQAPAYDLQ